MGFIFGIAGFVLAVAALLFGFSVARTFVRSKLRYVEGAQTIKAPLLAGIAAGLIALPFFAFLPLPFFGTLTALMFGLSVGAGVRAGARDIRQSAGYIEGP